MAPAIPRPGRQKPSYATARSNDHEQENSIIKPWRSAPVGDQTNRPAGRLQGGNAECCILLLSGSQ